MLSHPRKIGGRFPTASKFPSQSPVRSAAIKALIQLTLSMKPFQYLHMLDVSKACVMKLEVLHQFLFFTTLVQICLCCERVFFHQRRRKFTQCFLVSGVFLAIMNIPKGIPFHWLNCFSSNEQANENSDIVWSFHYWLRKKVSVSTKASSIPLPLRYFLTQCMAAFVMWKPPIIGTKFRKCSGCFKKISVTMQ